MNYFVYWQDANKKLTARAFFAERVELNEYLENCLCPPASWSIVVQYERKTIKEIKIKSVKKLLTVKEIVSTVQKELKHCVA